MVCKNYKMKERIMSIALCVCMVSSLMPSYALTAHAAEVVSDTAGLCEHHTEHNAECGYVEAVEGSPCSHTHDETCGYDTVSGNEACNHVHDEACGYVEAVEGTPCNYVCELCTDDNNVEQQENEIAECTCGTDDDSIHATNCPVYVAPEHPECFCWEKCTEDNVNIWCDVCGFDITQCGGTGSAVVYGYTYMEGNSDDNFGINALWLCTDGNDKNVKYKILTVAGDSTNGTVSVCGHNGVSGAITIPATITLGENTFTVTAIEANAFNGCSALTSVTLPSSDITIGDGAFEGTGATCANHRFTNSADCDVCDFTCTHSFSESGVCTVCGITTGGYCGASTNPNGGKTSVTWTLKDGTLTISGSGAMADYTYSYSSTGSTDAPWYANRYSIQTVTITGEITKIGECAFFECKNLTSITIPDSVKSIEYGAFYECDSLTSIEIPDSVTSIGIYAFEGSGLTNINIPNGVTSISRATFSACSDLTTITIPDSVTSIEQSAFYACRSLTTITIPDSVTSIGERAFRECEGLISITIPDSVTSIGRWAFLDCTALKSITIPDSVTSIGESAFMNCDNLTTVNASCKWKTYFENYENIKTFTHTKTDEYVAKGNKIYYKCENDCPPDEQLVAAELELASDDAIHYTGKEITPAVKVAYVNGASEETLPLTESACTYFNNIELGNAATCTATYNGVYELTLNFTINKAIPDVQEPPKVANRTYEPSVTLQNTDLTGGTVLGVNGESLAGTWSWKEQSIVPTVNNEGYEAVFTPADTTHYEAVTAIITVNVTAKELTVTGATATSRAYNGTDKVEITDVALDGIVSGEDVKVDHTGLQGTLSSANAGNYTSVTLPELTLTGDDAENYTLVQPTGAVATSVEISKADAEITVAETSYNKTYGAAAFNLGVTDTNTEADVTYASSDENVVTVSNGTVTIKGPGTATITVSLDASTNYNAADSKTITVNVAKATYSVEEINKRYLYFKENADSIDLAELFPKDCGTVSYGTPSATGDITYFKEPSITDGTLSYTLNSGAVDATGTITVKVETQNYEDITITVNVKLIDKIPVSIKEGTEVTLKNNTLTYGEALSKLEFNNAVFEGADGKEVEGTLVWEEPLATPNAGTTTAKWVFTPNDEVYASLEGTVAITVNKATPTVSAVPTVEDRVYSPTVTLQDKDLENGAANVAGTWNWQTAGIIPVVNNTGYVAVFTPDDITNYETVAKTITVNVTKATPYIVTAPSAADITYGATLGSSNLSGGVVQYSNADSTAVAGYFAWKDGNTKPAVSDSNSTTYTVVFTPADRTNYNTVETTITLTVNKAEDAPDMPGNPMSVPYSNKTVGAVTLPEGWAWQDADKNTSLEVGVSVEATAVYTGTDKGNYENETVVITITRSACEHTNTEIRNAKTATCQETGYTGDTYCKDCGEKIAEGKAIEKKAHTYGEPAFNWSEDGKSCTVTFTCEKDASHTEIQNAAITSEVKTNATCKDKGTTTYTATYTDADKIYTTEGKTYTDTKDITDIAVDATNHAGETEVRDAKEATCGTEGYTGDTYCKDCGEKIATGKKIEKSTTHTWDAGVVTKKATSAKKGEKTYTCSICKTTRTEEIPALGAPAKGTKLIDDSGKATYKVTKSDLVNGTVTYVVPTDKKQTKVTIPDTVVIDGVTYKVTAIEKNAFKKNKNIKSVTIGKNVKSIGANAFYNCTNLKTVKFGSSVTTIGDKAFYKCTSLTKITIPSKVKTIGKQAFYGCKKVTSVTIGKSVTKIGSKAFYGCSKIKKLTIKSTKLTTKKIGSKAFGKTPKSMTVKVPKKKFKAYKSMLQKKGVNKKAKFKKI